MKRFRFSLERVLDYRKQMELDRQRTFARAAEIFRRREENLRGLAKELETYRTRLAEMGTGRISARELALYRSYLTYLEARVEEAAAWLEDAARDMEARREELVKASKEKKVLDKVKDHKRAEYDYDAAREDTAQLDEVGATGFIAKSTTASGGDA